MNKNFNYFLNMKQGLFLLTFLAMLSISSVSFAKQSPPNSEQHLADVSSIKEQVLAPVSAEISITPLVCTYGIVAFEETNSITNVKTNHLNVFGINLQENSYVAMQDLVPGVTWQQNIYINNNSNEISYKYFSLNKENTKNTTNIVYNINSSPSDNFHYIKSTATYYRYGTVLTPLKA